MSSIDQQFIEYIVKSLVGKPDAVKVDRRIDERGVLLELTVDPEDLGRVIGKRGSTAQSIRTLLRALGTKNDARYNLKIIDNGAPPPRRDRDDESQKAEPAKADSAKQLRDNDDDSAKPKKDDADDSKPADDGKDDVKPADDDDIDMADDGELPDAPTEDHSDVISRTRKELEDLDDLDV